MSSEAQDEEIDEILEKIIGARQTLGAKRKGLLEDTEKLFAAKEELVRINSPSKDSELPIPAPINGATDAEEVSHRILGVLTGHKQGIADDPMVLKSFIG